MSRTSRYIGIIPDDLTYKHRNLESFEEVRLVDFVRMLMLILNVLLESSE